MQTTIIADMKSSDLLNICRTCLNELSLEKNSIFNSIEFELTSEARNSEVDKKQLKMPILDIIRLCTTHFTVIN